MEADAIPAMSEAEGEYVPAEMEEVEEDVDVRRAGETLEQFQFRKESTFRPNTFDADTIARYSFPG